VRIEPDERGAPSVVEVLHVDPSTARDGEPPPLLRKKRAERRQKKKNVGGTSVCRGWKADVLTPS